jgi:DNA mismatch repair protein MutH
MKHITRFEATQKLQKLIGQDLRFLADEFNVTVFKKNKLNKGWAGLTLEKAIGLGNNAIQASNGDFWELKLVPLIKRKDGTWKIKETMAITMINPKDVMSTPFEKSHLYDKMRKMIICGRERVNNQESTSKLLYVNSFDLLTTNYWEQIKKDYELVQKTIQETGFDSLSGKMGKFIQPRTKGQGGSSKKTRAFYARTKFIAMIFGMD